MLKVKSDKSLSPSQHRHNDKKDLLKSAEKIWGFHFRKNGTLTLFTSANPKKKIFYKPGHCLTDYHAVNSTLNLI